MSINGSKVVSVVVIIVVFIALIMGLQVFFLRAQSVQGESKKAASAGVQTEQLVDQVFNLVQDTSFEKALKAVQDEDKILHYMLGLSKQEIDIMQKIVSDRFTRADHGMFEQSRQKILQMLDQLQPVQKNIAQTVTLMTDTWNIQDMWPVYLVSFVERLKKSTNPETKKLSGVCDRFVSLVNNNRDDAKAIVNALISILRSFVDTLGSKLKDARSMKIQQLAQTILDLDNPVQEQLTLVLEKVRALNRNNQLTVLLNQLDAIDFSKIDYAEFLDSTPFALPETVRAQA